MKMQCATTSAIRRKRAKFSAIERNLKKRAVRRAVWAPRTWIWALFDKRAFFSTCTTHFAQGFCKRNSSRKRRLFEDLGCTGTSRSSLDGGTAYTYKMSLTANTGKIPTYNFVRITRNYAEMAGNDAGIIMGNYAGWKTWAIWKNLQTRIAGAGLQKGREASAGAFYQAKSPFS